MPNKWSSVPKKQRISLKQSETSFKSDATTAGPFSVIYLMEAAMEVPRRLKSIFISPSFPIL